jgi:hypothetical protein
MGLFDKIMRALATTLVAANASAEPKTPPEINSPFENPASASHTGIHPWLNVGERLTAEVFLDGKAVAKMDYLAEHGGVRREPALKFPVPLRLRTLRLSGKLVAANGKTRSFDGQWNVVDIAQYSAPLYDARLSLPERFKAFSELLSREAEKSNSEFSSPISLKNAEAEDAEALDALETQLKIRLPGALRGLSRYEIGIGESRFVKPTELTTVMETLSTWDYPKQGPDSLEKILSPGTRARYERSVFVFLYEGDGLGGLAWDPQGVTKGEPSNNRVDKHSPGAVPGVPNAGVWYWLHQDHINAPELLLDARLQPRVDEEALLNPIQRLALESVIDSLPSLREIKEPSLILDSAHPHGFLHLHFDPKGKPVLELRSYGDEVFSRL